MNIVFCHIGAKPLPQYAITAFKQARRFFDGDIHLIAPQRELDKIHDAIDNLGIAAIDSAEFDNSEKNKEYNRVTFLDYPGWDGFWSVTLQRMIYVEDFMRKAGITEVVHIENDNLLYHNPEDCLHIFKKLFTDKIAVSDGADNHSSCGYVYIDTADGCGVMNDRFIEYLAQGKPECLKATAPEDVSEMTLLSAMRKAHPDELGVLPILPNGQGSQNISEFGCLFDSMSWGQWVCGVHQNPGTPYATKIHWVGQRILANELDAKWAIDEAERKIPMVIEKATERSWRLNNLHVHSKELDKWI
jgi:hypothetical protein